MLCRKHPCELQLADLHCTAGACRAARYCFAAAHGGQIMVPLQLAQQVVYSWTGTPHSLQVQAGAPTLLPGYCTPAMSQLLPRAPYDLETQIAAWIPGITAATPPDRWQDSSQPLEARSKSFPESPPTAQLQAVGTPFRASVDSAYLAHMAAKDPAPIPLAPALTPTLSAIATAVPPLPRNAVASHEATRTSAPEGTPSPGAPRTRRGRASSMPLHDPRRDRACTMQERSVGSSNFGDMALHASQRGSEEAWMSAIREVGKLA